jgi:putative FmdB family regulatory protein
MPIFEYVCGECDRRFELLLRGAEKPACPGCGSRRLEKRLSVFAVGAAEAPARASASPGPCGTCGDPRGPGSCSIN